MVKFTSGALSAVLLFAAGADAFAPTKSFSGKHGLSMVRNDSCSDALFTVSRSDPIRVECVSICTPHDR